MIDIFLFVQCTGTTEGIAVIENLMEHVARARKEDPLEFRLKNMNPNDEQIVCLKNIIDQLRMSSDYNQRVQQVKTI